MKKVFVVDDDIDILEALSMMFQEAGYGVIASSTGENVYEVVNAQQPDILILDVLLSGRDGRTIAKNLKSNDNTKSLPIIMISAHPSAAKSSREVGADDFLAKPFDMNSIIGKVRGIIGN